MKRQVSMIFSAALMIVLFVTLPTFSQSKKSDSFFNKGVELYNKGKYNEAIPCFEKVIALDNKEINPESGRFGYGNHWLSSCYRKLGNTEKAREVSPNHYLFEPIDRRLTIESDKETDLASHFMQTGQIEEAIEHSLKCLDLEIASLGKYSVACIGSHLSLGDAYLQIHDYDKALNNYNKGLSILDYLNIEYSSFNFNLFKGRLDVHLSNNDITSAFSEMKNLDKIAEYQITNFEDHYPNALVELLYTKIYTQNNDYEQSATHAVNAFKSLLNQYKPDKEEQFLSLLECINTLLMISRYETASQLLNEALGKISNAGHKGLLLSYLGEITGDINTYQESLNLLSGTQYVDMYNSTKCLLGQVLWGNGEIEKSIDILQQVCDYYIKNDPEAPTYRNALMSLGNIYESIGNFELSNESYKQILALLENQKDSPDYCLTFLRWIPIYYNCSASKGNFENFENSYAAGVNIGEEFKNLMANFRISEYLNNSIGLPTIVDIVLPVYHMFLSRGMMHPGLSWHEIEKELHMITYDYLIPLCSNEYNLIFKAKSLLAHANYLLGNNQKAIDLTGEIISSCKQLEYPYDNYIHDLAYYQYDSGDTTGAFDNFKIGYDFNKRKILNGYRWMTLEEREILTRAFRGNLDNIPHYSALTPNDSRYAELGYNALLFTKGLLLNSSIELSRLLQEEGDETTLNLLSQWRKKNQEYQFAQQREDYDKAKRIKVQADILERQLIESSKSYGDYTDGLSIDYKQVQNNLKENDTAIEFFHYTHDARSKMYGAIVLRNNMPPKYIPIGLDRDLSKHIDDCYTDENLFNSLFSNLKPYLPDKDEGNIYFAADGILHTIAIENLPGSEKYNLKRLSSTREIALKRDQQKELSEIAVIGGVKYGIGKLAEYYKNIDSEHRGSQDAPAYLPGTKIEADKIEHIFAAKLKVSKFIADKATESIFKKFSGRNIGLLHIGTHGFFNQPLNVSNQASYEDDAMKFSGLYLAGALNTLWGVPTRNMKEDGILTAQEISTLDFRGLKLAVLSACETGKGSIGADGIFGLQRGFKQAGTEGIMMSLWKVDDKATQILMEEFYKNISAGSDQYVALRDAQNAVKEKYPDPKYWAAFILIDAIGKIKL